MKAEEKESSKSKPRLNIPEGAMVIIPLRNRVLFPSMIMPVMVRRPERLHAVEETVRQQLPIGFVTQRDPNIDAPQPKDLYESRYRRGCSPDVYAAGRSAADPCSRPPPL